MASKRESRNYETANFGVEDCEALMDYFNCEVKEEVVKKEVDIVSLYSKTNNTSGTFFISLASLSSKSESLAQRSSILEECLSVNQALLIQIQGLLKNLEICLEKNISKQDQLIEAAKSVEKGDAEKVKRSKPISLFAAPYFRDARGMVAPANEDSIEKIKRGDVTAFLTQPKPWARYDKHNLIEGVAANALSIALKPLKMRRDHLKSKLKDKNLLDFELKIVSKQISKIEKKIKEESARSLIDVLEEVRDKIDWMTVSATNLQGARTDEECEIMWNNFLSYRVNKEPFTAKEDKKLKKLVMKYRRKNWDAIAEELKTNRTAIQCLERYQTHLNDELTKKYWTPEEDEHLLKVVESLRVGKFIPWNKVCCYMEGRTRHQVINRYERTVNVDIKRGPFSSEEDAMIIALVKKFGVNWAKMKEFLPGRTTYSIRERYVNALDPSLKIGSWSIEEDKQLIRLIKKIGYGKWAAISREMHGRTDNMCLVRARRLEIHARRSSKSKNEVIHDEESGIALKPNAPSKQCFKQNRKLKKVQKSAEYILRQALEKIQPFVSDAVDVEKLDTSSFSMHSLQLLQKELFKRLPVENNKDKWTPHYVPLHFQRSCLASYERKKRKQPDLDDFVSSEDESPANKRRKTEDSEEDLETHVVEEERETHLNSTEKLWIDEVLQYRFKEDASLIPSGLKQKCISLNARESAECAFYRKYLKKTMFCKSNLESEENEVDLKPEYQNNLASVIRYFIQPDTEELQPSVLCPNAASVGTMEIIEATLPRLRRTAGFINQSKHYLKYLVRQTNIPPRCAKCRGLSKNATPENLNYVHKQMQNRLLVFEESLMKAVKIETGFSTDTCKCEDIARSKEAFDLLQKRFLSIFLWPSLLSSVDLSEEQVKTLGKNVPNNYNATKVKPQSYPGEKKKGRPKKIQTDSAESSASIVESSKQDEPVRKTLKRRITEKLLVKNSPKAAADFVRKKSTKPRRSQRNCVLNRTSFASPERYPVKDKS